MSASPERCDDCGGSMVPCAHTRHTGEGENTVAYHHYAIRCSSCGRVREDARLGNLNAAGAAAADGIASGRGPWSL
jgi:hypothetical protein